MAPLWLLAACWPASAADPPADPPAADVLYQALHGEPEDVDAGHLLSAPGRFVGRAVRTRGRLERPDAGQHAFELSAGRGRMLLRLEPQAAAMTVAHADAWTGKAVDVEGFFFRDLEDRPEASYVLRAWLVRPAAATRTAASRTAAGSSLLTLQDLVYGAGRHDGRLVRVRGAYRGSNVQRDLPEATRKTPRDWVLKDGHFAVWITGREAYGGGRGREDGGLETGVALEVVGTPTTSRGVVRIAAREVGISPAPPAPAIGRALATGDAGWAAVSPRLSFTYPVPGEPLRRRGQVVLQFNKPMDPSRFEGAVRVRYERDGPALAAPRLAFDYRDRFRALVVTPDPPPPPNTTVVVELGEGIIDVDGRALAPPDEPLRFRRGP